MYINIMHLYALCHELDLNQHRWGKASHAYVQE